MLSFYMEKDSNITSLFVIGHEEKHQYWVKSNTQMRVVMLPTAFRITD